MTKNKEKRDKHFPLIGHRIARLFEPPKKFIVSYVTKGQVVADLGCGPGFYSLHFAKILGPEGKVYSVDSDERCIKALEKKAKKRGYNNIEAYSSCASNLSFIEDNSIDFVFSNGLLCSIAPKQRETAVEEIKRILKPNGLAFLSAARASYSYMNTEEWENIIEGFKIIRREDKRSLYSAEVSLK
ncbi:MAG: class I SAM-dependent methyltransferase [Candidatus Heimdallarchaeota archaeon]|nr:class I SAM-dependent methyltransferase [Candidatus Heimdallarchaeota archaeon]MCK5143896.1 class I SAM-dependent methyltransferase [Candidatus Heimdallarchaeota archaeon]